jgi:hypothetical protein
VIDQPRAKAMRSASEANETSAIATSNGPEKVMLTPQFVEALDIDGKARDGLVGLAVA